MMPKSDLKSKELQVAAATSDGLTPTPKDMQAARQRPMPNDGKVTCGPDRSNDEAQTESKGAFKRLVGKLEDEGKSGTSAKDIAAAAAFKKYGKADVERHAAEHKPMDEDAIGRRALQLFMTQNIC
jgi:hypothetical protein